MKIVVTGNTGSGKSTVAKLLQNEFYNYSVVIDVDRYGHSLLEFDKEVIDKVTKTFGTTDRAILRKKVFYDPTELKKLNAIMHPIILEELRVDMQRYDNVIVDCALAFDLGLDKEFDVVIVVDANREVRLERLVTFRGIPKEDAEKQIDSQNHFVEFINSKLIYFNLSNMKIDYLIINNKETNLKNQVQDIVKVIKKNGNNIL